MSGIDAEDMHFEQKFNFYVRMKNPRVLRARCSKCTAFLSYRTELSNEIHKFRLKSYRLGHNHLLKTKNTKKSCVVNYLRSHL